VKSAFKRSARRLVDRTLTPHLDRQTTDFARVLDERLAAPAPPAPAGHLLLTAFNHLLHELRTIELRNLPATDRVLLSAGCAGGWYFEWLEAAAGPFERHIGVELYSPRPERLPTGVTWIVETASHMPTIEPASVDVVFSGQNFEHLWIDDMAGFLGEAYRVLRPGGHLVVDSPNRLATEALAWVHPEHTIELTADEAVELFTLAGFDVETVRGLWSCRDRTGAWQRLEPEPGDAAAILDRAARRSDVDDTFIWWIEARRSDRPVDQDAVAAHVAGLFARHWPARVARGTELLPVVAGATGVVYRTAALPLFAGTVDVTASHPQLTVHVQRADGSTVASAPGELTVDLATTEFGAVVELIAERPLPEPVDAPGVTIGQHPRPPQRGAHDDES